MAKKQELTRIYWDACCFLTILNDEEKAAECTKILDEAKAGRTEIVTSFWTIAEVIRPKSTPAPLPEDKQDMLRDFFENSYIKLRTVDRLISENARRLCWDHNIVYACDAVHLASALDTQCHVLETFDRRLRDLNGLLGDPLLEIRVPTWKGQTNLLDET